MKRELSVKSQSVETSGITKDYKEALCEYIWNGFEANATEVSLSYTTNSAERTKDYMGIEAECFNEQENGASQKA